MQALTTYAGQQVLDMTGGLTVTPAQFLGLEINPRAAAIADVVLWIGYLQWHFRTFGHARRLDPPILRNYKNITVRDAVLEFDERVPRRNPDGSLATHWDGRSMRPHPVTGEMVPDDPVQEPIYDYINPKAAAWPDANFIVGNPPFVGHKRMRLALGDGYVDALRRAYRGQLPDSADFVLYWWYKAAEQLRNTGAESFGFITTNSLTQTYNRAVVEAQLSADEENGLALAFAIPDHPWVDDALGAAV